MKIKGHKLGEMDVLLLRKIEELTLYVIELKKENEVQHDQLKIQREAIDRLLKEIR